MSLAKIGVLGGTFDPVHLGHLQLARAAIDECTLDRVVFIPAAQPPHKDGATVTSFDHRAAMLRLASTTDPGFECDLIEEGLPKPSYTIDTMKTLQEAYGDQVQLHFILGADAFLEIATWKAYEALLGLVAIIISLREGFQRRLVVDLLQELGYTAESDDNYQKGSSHQVYLLRSTPADISSSAIRGLIGRGESATQLLPEGVAEYIQQHRLYRSDPLTKSQGR